MDTATFGAGCFWHVEAAFRNIDGVVSTAVGFMGGKTGSPSYDDVCAGGTGHVEVVQVEFDTGKVSYNELLDVFWKIHDPTQKDRQGPDVGIQYRSVIFYHSEEQRQEALKSREELQKGMKKKIMTKIEPASRFWKAEEYHQKYFEKHGRAC
jgi:peptide-methionine (S)-S-oxide reductase